MKRLMIAILFFSLFTFDADAQNKVPYSQQLSLTAMHLWPDSFSVSPGVGRARWSYDQGVILKGIEGVWMATGDAKWFNYLQHSMDYSVSENGSILDYKESNYNIDYVNNGKVLLTLYRVTGKEKYRKAIKILREQLRKHPRTKDSSFWHKKIYPNQVWLDGLYMAQPFYAEYAMVFDEPKIFDDVAKQFINIENHARDAKTGLLFHGYDESREQLWADKTSGLSPHFWGRSLGWFGMAIVDALDYFPTNHPERKNIIDILKRLSDAVIKVQDKKTGMWYDIVDLPQRSPNYVETSATAMLAYTLAKGVRMGYLDSKFQANAQQAFDGIVKSQITIDKDVYTNLEGTVSVSGLGGKPYRDGSFEYYMSEKVVQNDPKGMGAFILAANEIEMIPNLSKGKNKKIVLDNYFNNEWRTTKDGRNISWHYTWEDRANSGYYFLGNIFQQNGAEIATLKQAPDSKNLKNASVYIIVDPDTEKETSKPNYLNQSYATNIANWVKAGGVLVLLANDAGNCELKNFNLLAQKFGIRFNEDNKLMVKNNNYSQGEIMINANNPIFKTAKNIYLKEISSLSLKSPARAVLRQNDFNVMAVSKYGKGLVFALGDPWIYNEYVDGRKLPLQYENYKAAVDWVRYLLTNTKIK